MCELAEINKDLVGRYFKDSKRYYKILSCQSQNEYKIECLVFSIEPEATFINSSHKVIQAGDGFLGQFSFSSFETKSIMASVIRDLKEIDKEEFDEAAKNFLSKLLSMEWTATSYKWE